MKQEEALDTVTTCLKSVIESEGLEVEGPILGSTRLMGRDSMLDSLALVNLLIEVEQRLAEQTGVTLTLANEQALSRRNSPFRTVDTLAEYIVELAGGLPSPA